MQHHPEYHITNSMYYEDVFKTRDVIVALINQKAIHTTRGEIIAAVKHQDFLSLPISKKIDNLDFKRDTFIKLLQPDSQLGNPSRHVHRTLSHDESLEDLEIEVLSDEFNGLIAPKNVTHIRDIKQQFTQRKPRSDKQSSSESPQGSLQHRLQSLNDDEIEQVCKNIAAGQTSELVKPILEKRPSLKFADALVINRTIIGMGNNAAKKNNPSPSQANVHSFSILAHAYLSIEAIDQELALYCLMLWITGIPSNRLQTLWHPKGDHFDLDYDIQRSIITYQIKNHIGVMHPESDIFKLPVFEHFTRILCLSNFNPERTYPIVRKTLAKQGIWIPKKIHQWSQGAHECLQDVLRPYDRQLISGSLDFAYNSESAYTETKHLSIVVQYHKGLKHFISRFEELDVPNNSQLHKLKHWLNTTDICRDLANSKDMRHQAELFKNLCHSLHLKKVALIKQLNKNDSIGQITIIIDLYNVCNYYLALMLQVCTVCRPHWHSIDIISTASGLIVQDKDVNGSGEFRHIASFDAKQWQTGNTYLHQQLGIVHTIEKGLRTVLTAYGVACPTIERGYDFQPMIIDVKGDGALSASYFIERDYFAIAKNLLKLTKDQLPITNFIRHLTASLRPEFISKPMEVSDIGISTYRANMGHTQSGLGHFNSSCSSQSSVECEQRDLVQYMFKLFNIKPTELSAWRR